ncbi:hypothetical protein P7C70_g3377, partial [Phenoliferia sp. Uapishka_3]
MSKRQHSDSGLPARTSVSNHSADGNARPESGWSMYGLGLDEVENLASTSQPSSSSTTSATKSFFGRIPSTRKKSQSSRSENKSADGFDSAVTSPDPSSSSFNTSNTASPSSRAIGVLMSEVARLKNALATIQTTNSGLETTVITLETRCADLEKTKNDLMDELERLSVELFQEANMMVSDERKKRAKADEEVERLTAEVKRLSAIVDVLRKGPPTGLKIGVPSPSLRLDNGAPSPGLEQLDDLIKAETELEEALGIPSARLSRSPGSLLPYAGFSSPLPPNHPSPDASPSLSEPRASGSPTLNENPASASGSRWFSFARRTPSPSAGRHEGESTSFTLPHSLDNRQTQSRQTSLSVPVGRPLSTTPSATSSEYSTPNLVASERLEALRDEGEEGAGESPYTSPEESLRDRESSLDDDDKPAPPRKDSVVTAGALAHLNSFTRPRSPPLVSPPVPTLPFSGTGLSSSTSRPTIPFGLDLSPHSLLAAAQFPLPPSPAEERSAPDFARSPSAGRIRADSFGKKRSDSPRASSHSRPSSQSRPSGSNLHSSSSLSSPSSPRPHTSRSPLHSPESDRPTSLAYFTPMTGPSSPEVSPGSFSRPTFSSHAHSEPMPIIKQSAVPLSPTSNRNVPLTARRPTSPQNQRTALPHDSNISPRSRTSSTSRRRPTPLEVNPHRHSNIATLRPSFDDQNSRDRSLSEPVSPNTLRWAEKSGVLKGNTLATVAERRHSNGGGGPASLDLRGREDGGPRTAPPGEQHSASPGLISPASRTAPNSQVPSPTLSRSGSLSPSKRMLSSRGNMPRSASSNKELDDLMANISRMSFFGGEVDFGAAGARKE